ncbi:MAG: hypothetical protein N3H30_01965 [Candidatus Micrarchaeota archaeon]|nr:hypothetical protein [Candidatus Micrarchaeota archaeon]
MSAVEKNAGARFAAGIVKRIYARPGLFKAMKEKSSLKEELNSAEFKERLGRLSPQAQRIFSELFISAEERGALNFVIGCVYGIKEENPKYFDYLRRHIMCWDNRKALEKELDNAVSEFKERYGFAERVDRLVSRAKSLDISAVSLVFASISGFLISQRPLAEKEISSSLEATESILSAW